jgi:hypothetical protein
VHYLAFDLYVGAMQVKQAQRDQLSHLVLIPVLIATFLLGPMGMLAFFVVRSIRRGQAVEVTA